MTRTLLCLTLIAVSANAQSAETGVAEWLRSYVNTKVGVRKKTQTDTVSLNRGSTSFVDQTSAADLVSTAFSFVPVGAAKQGAQGGGTASASLYAIYTLATGQDPLRPSVYTKGATLRQFSFNVGREDKKDTPQGNESGTVAGARYVLWNQREASKLAKDDALMATFTAISNTLGGAASEATKFMGDFLFDELGPASGLSKVQFINKYFASRETIDQAVAMLTASQQKEFYLRLDRIVAASAVATKQLADLVEALQRRPQLAVDFQTTQRPGTSEDFYRSQLIFDAGLRGNLFTTFNGSFDYADSKAIGADRRGGRAAGEIRKEIASMGGASLRQPIQLGLSGEGIYSKADWTWRTQVRVVIPLAPGISIPFSVGWGNSQELLKAQEKEVFGKFGVTFDFAKILAGLRSQ